MQTDIILEADLTPTQVAELAVMAEGYGIRGLWTSNYADGRDPFMCLMPAATATKRILLGVCIVSPYEMHPLKIANAVSTLNEASGNRGMVVIGGGGQWPGIMAMTYGKRVTGLGEAISMVKRAVSGQMVNWEGKVYRARYFRSTWLKGRPPLVYAGATGPKMLDMAVRCADGTMFSDITEPMLPGAMATIRASLAREKRDAKTFLVNNFCAFHVKKDREASFREARRELMLRGWLGPEWYEPFLTKEESAIVRDNMKAFLMAFRTKSGEIQGVPPAIVARLVDGLSLAGDLSDLDRHVERLKLFAAAGMTENALRLHDEPAEGLYIIGRELLPRMR